MTLDLTSPASIRAWLAVWPERHRALLRGMWRLWPQFRQSIEEAARHD